MKVLDPQSALLTNSEVAAHLAELSKKPEHVKENGSYPKPNLTGYNAILKDFSRYHISTTPPNLNSLVRRLKPYDLTKTEVLNLINLNLGAKVSDEEIKQEDGEEEEVTSRDLALFRVTVEDCEERFPGEEGEERIGEVVGILKEKV